MAKKSKEKRKKKKKKEWARLRKKLESGHCFGWGFFVGKEIACRDIGVTKQCAKCFSVTEGPKSCIDCKAELESLENRTTRGCPKLQTK